MVAVVTPSVAEMPLTEHEMSQSLPHSKVPWRLQDDHLHPNCAAHPGFLQHILNVAMYYIFRNNLKIMIQYRYNNLGNKPQQKAKNTKSKWVENIQYKDCGFYLSI